MRINSGPTKELELPAAELQVALQVVNQLQAGGGEVHKANHVLAAFARLMVDDFFQKPCGLLPLTMLGLVGGIGDVPIGNGLEVGAKNRLGHLL